MTDTIAAQKTGADWSAVSSALSTQHSALSTDPHTVLSVDERTEALLDAFPYICDFVGKTIVVKVGGSVGDEGTVLDDIVWLKRLGINPVVVHGGGPQISERLSRLGVETRFVEGRRFTDEATLEVVHEVLMRINGAFVSYLNAQKSAPGAATDWTARCSAPAA